MVDRPNLFIKIPAVLGGLPAVADALAEGISVNVTLIFSLDRYAAVQDAYLSGLERRLAAGHDLDGLQSVASFFVSRVDTEIDRQLPTGSPLRGQAATANARLAYAAHRQLLGSPRWQALAGRGAAPQRPLWASTGVKDPGYDDTRYVIGLAAPGTVNTMPAGTLEAVTDHGAFQGDTISGTEAGSQAVLDAVTAAGVDYNSVVDQLEEQGVQPFAKAWTALIEATVGQLEQAGGQVRPDGSTIPAGDGPAAAPAG